MSSDFLHWEDGGIFVTYRTTITFACPIRSWWDFTKCFWIMSEHGFYWTDRNKRSNLGWFQRDRLFLPIRFTLPLLHPSSLAALGYRQWRFWSCELEWYFLVTHNVVFCSRAGQTQCLGFLFLREQQWAAWSGDGILSWGWEVLVLGERMGSSGTWVFLLGNLVFEFRTCSWNIICMFKCMNVFWAWIFILKKLGPYILPVTSKICLGAPQKTLN